MRKLKALFVLLFAACLSLTLFACGGGENPGGENPGGENPGGENPGGSGTELRIERLSIRGLRNIELTDESTEADFTSALGNITVVVTYTTGDPDTVKGSDCTVDHNIDFDDLVIDTYTVTLTPKENNADNKSVNITATVDHNWVADASNPNKFTCPKDKATKTVADEDIAIHYGTFHNGIDDTNATAIGKAALTADEAAELEGLSAETTNGKVFNAAAGINAGVTSSGRITEIGDDESWDDDNGTHGARIPSLTAGRLEPGMSITIEGYAKQDTGTNGPWGTVNEYYNAPSFGIADRFATTSLWTNKGNYAGGNSVIVRSEGWVLYDGIGTTRRTLAGLPAFIVGGGATKSGDNAIANYGSHPSETKDILGEGYDANNIPDPTSDAWKDWWVYSSGSTTNSGDQYGSYTKIVVTWTYRTYNVSQTQQVGVIDIVRTVGSYTLTSRIKVPAATRGYYDTIIHGDYCSLLITNSTVVETETTTDMKVEGLKAGAQAKYLAGQTIDAANTVSVKIDTAQNPGVLRDYTISNDMLYYYTGEMTLAALKANDAAAQAELANKEVWTAVGNSPLSTAMKIFKVEFNRSDKDWRGLVLDAEGGNAITVVDNNVKAAYGFNFNGTLKNNKKTGAYTLGITAEGNAQFTLESGVAQAIPAGAYSVFEGITDATAAAGYRYFVAKIEGIGDFTAPSITTDTANVKIATTVEGDEILIAFAIKKEALGQAIVVKGIQTNDVEFVFGTGIIGFDVVSTSTPQVTTGWKLDQGGSVTLEYDTTEITAFNVWFGGNRGQRTVARLTNATTGVSQGPVEFADDVYATAFSQENGKTSITIKFPAFTFGATEMPRVEAVNGSNIVATDYLDYGFEFSTESKFVQDGYYFYVDETAKKLYVVKAVAATDGAIDFASNAVKGDLKVTANNGDLATAKELDLSFRANHSVLEFVNTTLADKVREVGEGEDAEEISIYTIEQYLFTSTEGDAGLIVMVGIDMEGAFGFEGAYGIEVNPGTESEYYWWYDPAAEQDQFTREEIPADAELSIIEEGSCLVPGIIAKTITNDEDEVIYFAAYQEIGGEHSFEGNTCTKCGATRSEVVSEGYTPEGGNHVDDVFAWYGTSATSSLAKGDIVEGRGTFKDNKSTFGTNGIGILVWEDSNKALFQVAGIGDVLYGGDDPASIWTRKEPYDETAFPNGSERITSSNITEEHPYNTLNGVLDKDGVAVNIDNMATMLKGGGFRYIVEHRGDLIVATLNFYVEGQNFDDTPQFTMTATFTTKAGSAYEVWFMGGDGNNCYLDGNKIELIKSTADNSAISTVEAAEADGHAASSGVSFAPAGNTVTATGMAAKENTQFYLAFKVKFNKQLTFIEKAIVKNGAAEIAGSKAEFNQSHDELTVYLPIEKGNVPANVVIDLINYEAYTLQGDITINLENVICSDITATATGADALTVAGGEFTINYTGGVQATDTIAIGEESKAINALATEKANATAFGETGYSAYVSTALANGNVTVTFVKAAADLTKTIEGAQITLNRGDDVLALNSIAPAIGLPSGAQQIEATGWYAQAAGTTLTIYTNVEANKQPSTLPFTVNAGHVTDAEYLATYELAFDVTTEGAVQFENATSYLAKATTAAYTEYNGKFIVALTIDLTKFQIEAATAYGFAIENEGATKFYTVTATERTIAEATMEKSGAQLDIATDDPCTKDTVKGYGNGTTTDATFYYGLTVRPAGHEFPADGGLCTVCNEVTGWVQNDIVVGKADQWSTAAADGYDPADTEKFGAIVKGQKAVFEGTIKTATAAIGTSWLNMHGPLFKIGGLTIRCDGYVDALSSGTGDYAANKWHVNTVESVKYDGTDVASNVPWGSAVACRGNAEATITYDWTNAKEIVFTFFTQDAAHTFEIVGKITSTVEGGEFEKGIYEIGLLPFNCYFAGTLTVTGDKDVVSAENCNQWIRDPNADIPDPEYTEDSAITADGGLTIGTEGTAGEETGWTGYSNNPNWIGKLEKGKKIVITGTQKSMATQPFWSSLTFFVWSGTNAGDRSGDTGICMNHANPVGSGNEGGQNVEAWTIGGPAHKLTGGTDFAALIKEVGADCKVTITFDWTQYNKQFSVTMKLENADATKIVETTYTFTEDEGGTMLEAYNIGIGVDHSCATLTTITRTEQAPTQDLPGAEAVTHEHTYVNGLCSTCGGVQPASGVGGTAVTDKSWEKAQTFDAKIWTMTLKKGGKVVVYGTQEGDVASNWFSLLAYVGVDDNTKSITLRSDNFGFYDDNQWLESGPSHVLDDSKKENGTKSPNGEASALDWTAFAGIARHCDWRVEFDWTGDSIIVTMTFTGTADNQYTGMTVYFKYTLEAGTAETATIGLGSEGAAGTVSCYVATNND